MRSHSPEGWPLTIATLPHLAGGQDSGSDKKRSPTKSGLSDDGLKCADSQFTMEWDRNRDGAVCSLFLHNGVTAFLAHPTKAVRLQDATNFLSRENAQLRHGLLRSE